MTTDFDARDAMYSRVKTTVDSVAPGIMGYVPNIYWQDSQTGVTPPADKHWLRVGYQILESPQATLSNNVTRANNFRYRSFGFLIVEIHSPQVMARGGIEGDQLCVQIRNAFRGYSVGSLWFRNPRKKELPSNSGFYRKNVLVDFEYDDIG